jgi:hypothetical protein
LWLARGASLSVLCVNTPEAYGAIRLICTEAVDCESLTDVLHAGVNITTAVICHSTWIPRVPLSP